MKEPSKGGFSRPQVKWEKDACYKSMRLSTLVNGGGSDGQGGGTAFLLHGIDIDRLRLRSEPSTRRDPLTFRGLIARPASRSGKRDEPVTHFDSGHT